MEITTYSKGTWDIYDTRKGSGFGRRASFADNSAGLEAAAQYMRHNSDVEMSYRRAKED